jgi:hypothetical protein
LTIEVDDVEGQRERVASSGHPRILPDRQWALRDFRVSDPNGYCLRETSRQAGA